MDSVKEAKRMLWLYFQFRHPELLAQVLSEKQAVDLAEAIDRLIVARLAARETGVKE
jgi:hypothetical protein